MCVDWRRRPRLEEYLKVTSLEVTRGVAQSNDRLGLTPRIINTTGDPVFVLQNTIIRVC